MYKVSALLGFTRAELVSTEIWSDFVEHSGFQARIGLRGMFFVMGSPWLLHCPSHCPSTVPPLSLPLALCPSKCRSHCRSRRSRRSRCPSHCRSHCPSTVPPLSLRCPSLCGAFHCHESRFSGPNQAFAVPAALKSVMEAVWLAASKSFIILQSRRAKAWEL